MCLLPESKFQYVGFNVPASAVQFRAGTGSVLPFQNKVGICHAAQAGRSGDHIHRIAVVHLPQMVDQKDRDVVLVCQFFQQRKLPVVVCVGIGFRNDVADLLQRVDDNEGGIRVFREELFDLILQIATDAAGQIGEMQGVRRVVGDLKQAVLDTGVTVLQAQVEDGSLHRWKFPHRLAL